MNLSCINDGWKFMYGDGAGWASPEYDDGAWRELALPHDWGTEFPVSAGAPSGSGGGYAITGVGWYRKKIRLPALPPGGGVYLRFDGVFMDSSVYVDGMLSGGRVYGYSEFTVDLSDFGAGEHLVAVRVDNSLQPNSRWYTGSGIYRSVWLAAAGSAGICHNGVFVMTNALYESKSKARLLIKVRLFNKSQGPADLGITYKLADISGAVVAESASAARVPAGGEGVSAVLPTIEKPRLWSDKDPYLYTLTTEVYRNGEIIDTQITRVGIRTADFDCDRGFLLNGERVKIKGVCVHHDCGLAGAADYIEIWRRRLSLLKEMGCNGIRCAHNPPSRGFLDLCDELGFLVMDEAFDEWELTKIKSREYGYSSNFAYGYGQHFESNAEEDLVTMLRRDRNHPSVVLWSIGNEIPEQASADGARTLLRLQEICHREDPSRLVCSACDNIASPEAFRTREEFERALDVVGYNYTARWGMRAETLYDEDRKKYPERRMLGAENPSAGGLRGSYGKPEDGPGFRYGYDTATHNHEFLWRYTASRDFVAGDYLWTGIDYLGEAGWPSRGTLSGAIDTAGFPKDTFYYFKSIWNVDATTLHILPHWNWKGREGEFISVIGYTNCESVSLYINGRPVGAKGYDFPNVGALGAWNIRAKDTRPTTHDLHLQWDVPYEPGELKAVGYIGGKIAAEKTVRTTGAPAALRAEADVKTIKSGGIAQIEICAVDGEGLIVPDADTEVTATVEGAAALLGMDSGNPFDLAPFYSPARRLFSGKLLCAVRGSGKGPARVRLNAAGMDEIALEFEITE